MDEKRRAWLRQPTRVRIMDAAEDCLARDGYDGASVDEMAGVAGVSKSHLYYHFGSKAGLLACLVELRTDEFLRAKDAVFAGVPLADLLADPATVLERLTRAVTEVLVPRRAFLRIALVESLRDPAAAAPFFAALDALVDDTLSRFAALGTVRDEDAARTAILHLGILPCLYAVARDEDPAPLLAVLAHLETAVVPAWFEASR